MATDPVLKRYQEMAWEHECCEASWDCDLIDTAWDAELPDELQAWAILADADASFEAKLVSWDAHVVDKGIWLAIEQSCHEGVLLPPEQRAIRLATCPRQTREDLEFLVGHCPAHVLHRLALIYFWLVRMDRASRTGSPEWRPPAVLP